MKTSSILQLNNFSLLDFLIIIIILLAFIIYEAFKVKGLEKKNWDTFPEASLVRHIISTKALGKTSDFKKQNGDLNDNYCWGPWSYNMDEVFNPDGISLRPEFVSFLKSYSASGPNARIQIIKTLLVSMEGKRYTRITLVKLFNSKFPECRFDMYRLENDFNHYLKQNGLLE